MPKITPFLWFDTQAKEAADFYVSIFPNQASGTCPTIRKACPRRPVR